MLWFLGRLHGVVRHFSPSPPLLLSGTRRKCSGLLPETWTGTLALVLSGIGASGIAYNNALTELKNEAADRGATHVMLVDTSNSGMTRTVGESIAAERGHA
jgi:hypothetical protein